jgi:hypothetical protein
MDTSKQVLELQQQVEELLAFKRALEAAGTIPYEVDVAFKKRFSELVTLRLQPSSKAANAEDVTINEAGSATYSVLDNPDGFAAGQLEDGTTIAIPYFTL